MNLTVIGKGAVYHIGTAPLFGDAVVGNVFVVDVAMFRTACVLVDCFCKDSSEPVDTHKIKVMGAVHKLFEPTNCTIGEAKAAVEMVFALWAARGSINPK